MIVANVFLLVFLLIGFYHLGCRVNGKYWREMIVPERTSMIMRFNRDRVIRVSLITVAVLGVFLTTFSFVKAVVYGLCTFVLCYASERIKREKERKAVLIDVLNVCECLRVQLSSQIALNHALKNLPQLCKCNEFKRYLTDLFLEYELSKYTVSSSANKLGQRFCYPEMRIFLSVLNQQMQGTSRLESLDNLIEVLKEKYVEFLEDNTKNKITLMTAGVFLIVINLAAISIYPVLIESIESLRSILG